MSTITWPTTLKTGAVDVGVQFDVQMSVARNGHVYTYGLPGARWVTSITFENELESMQRPMIEALIVSLQGGANRLSMHHLGRPVPNGTLSGSPTLLAAVVAGATTLSLTNCNGTLKAGDIIGLAGQFMMVTADATPTFGNMTVSVSPAVRSAYNSGQPVVWNRPTTLWIPKTALAGPFPYMQNKVRPSFSIELVEA